MINLKGCFMKAEKAKLIKPKKNREENSYQWISSVIMFIIGVILFTNSSKAVIFVCYFIGASVFLIGCYNFYKYYQIKKELNYENTTNLILGVTAIVMGMIIILLASAIETFLRFIIGIILIINGLSKIKYGIDFRNYITMIIGIILIGTGLYTILAENLVFAFIGFFLIISSIMDLLKYFKTQKK